MFGGIDQTNKKNGKIFPNNQVFLNNFSGLHGQNRQGKHRMEADSLWRGCAFGKVKPRRMRHQC
jgi:hypothetical protein